MKSALFISGVLISLLIGSCQKTGKTTGQTPSQPIATEPGADEMIRDTVTNQEGVQLAMAFNKSKQTATFVLKGETIELKQDRMASGIKYGNSGYEFTEHQGEMTLKKSGHVIFTHKQ